MKSAPEFADVTVTTEASVTSTVTNIRVISVKSTEISLSWDAPSSNDGLDIDNDLIESYEVNKKIFFYYCLHFLHIYCQILKKCSVILFIETDSI